MFGLSDYPDAIIRGVALGLIALVWVILVVRVIGLRTFSKMTAFDFVITLATGSLLASVDIGAAAPRIADVPADDRERSDHADA